MKVVATVKMRIDDAFMHSLHFGCTMDTGTTEWCCWMHDGTRHHLKSDQIYLDPRIQTCDAVITHLGSFNCAFFELHPAARETERVDSYPCSYFERVFGSGSQPEALHANTELGNMIYPS